MGQTTGTTESEGKTLAGDPVEDPRYNAALRDTATAAAQGASLDEVLDAARNQCVALAAKRTLILPDVLKCRDVMTTSSGAAPCGSRCKPVQ